MPVPSELEFVPTISRERLNPRQAVDYNAHRQELHEWLQLRGKDPDQHVGYAPDSVDNLMARTDQFYRWVWDREGGYTTRVIEAHAEAFSEALQKDELLKNNGEPYDESSKRKDQDAVKALFEWRSRAHGGERWEPSITFSETASNHPDALTIEERQGLREAVLEYDSPPAYSSVSPAERERWNGYIAQKLGKPKEAISPDDWRRLSTSWELPSLLWSSLDAALRPVEVERATVDWARIDKGALYIPKEDSAKNRDYWEAALQRRTVKALDRWLEERENYSRYDDSDSLWLNQHGNPHSSGTLNYLLGNLLDEASITVEKRDLSWYSIRHSVGTHMTGKGDIAETQEQLRHKSLSSTLRYTHPSIEERQQTLDKMG